MPSQQEVRESRLKNGIIVLAAAALLTFLVFLMTTASGVGMFSHRLTVTSYFDDATGLKTGATVTLEGVTIGTVKTITVVAAPEHKAAPVQVVMKLDGKYQSDLHTDSTSSLDTIGVLGDTAIDISSQFAVGPPLRDGDELKTLAEPTLFSVEKAGQAAATNLKSTLQNMDALVDKMQSGKGSVGRFMSDPDLMKETNENLDEIHQLTAKLNSNDNSAGKFLNSSSPSAMSNALTRVGSVATDIGNGKGSIGKIMNDPSFQTNLTAAQANGNAVMADVDKGSIGMMMKDPTVINKMTDTLAQSNTLLTGINQGNGSLGKIATAEANLTQLQADGNAFFTDIRKNPKKFFTVEVRLF
jgi:phospholipid/cholesterol/gamma-HCH transport system substrate-binding protein